MLIIITKENNMSAFSMKTWLNKGYTEEEAKYQIAIRRPNNVLYYTNKGFSIDDAKEMVKVRQAKGGVKRSNMSIDEKRALSPRCIEFYLAKGLTYDRALLELSNHQSTFSKEKCIKKYGKDRGLEIFEARQDKWQATLNSKSAEEIQAINARKNRWLNLTDKEATLLKEQVGKNVKATVALRTENESRAVGKKIRDGQVASGRATPDESVDAFLLYKSRVWAETKRNNLTVLENHDKRSRLGYHLDHMYSIHEGFKNNVDVSIIGHIKNLKMIPYQENLSKFNKCSITLEELTTLIKGNNV